MDQSTVERRLAAILAADMVGYSRLMEADEAGTLARLKTHRLELIDPAIAKSKGKIVKTTGDGLLVEFQSVAGAVQSAVEIQRRVARRNADLPAARWIQFRIGICYLETLHYARASDREHHREGLLKAGLPP